MMTKRTYYLDDETIAFLDDAASRGWSKSQALRRACKAGIDVARTDGLDALPPDQQRRYEGPGTERKGHGVTVGADGVECVSRGDSSDRRPVPTVDDSLESNGDTEAHDETSASDPEASTSGRSSEGIFNNLFRS